MDAGRATFTFLFTDIEGSTRLWEEHAEEMALALAHHDTLLNEVFSTQGGHIFKMMGDAFCVAFQERDSAVRASVAAQRALLAEQWETPRPIKVRAALHRGLAEQRNGDYFGPTLNRTARLLAAGHGGQVLLSRAASEGLSLGVELQLRDLGERRLRDLATPEHVFQLLVPGLPEEFPALRSLEVMPNNLPASASSFVGRARELAELRPLLQQTRLLTLLGPGGTGKTRLSIEVASAELEHFVDGVWQVELATVQEDEAVLTSIAAALGLREERERPLQAILLEYLHDREILLLLDNCEHLVAECARQASAILRAAPKVRLLVTSREALGIPGETTYPVHSLSIPDFFAGHWTGELLAARADEFAALQLFTERARAAVPGFTLTEANALIVARICWRLDGIPLAIELAAARLRMLSPEQIYRRLDDRFRLLANGARTVLPRQQTLTALIDWSHDLLTEKEQMLLRRAAVFARGRTLRALEAVCAGEGLEDWEILDLCQQLVDKSLLSAEQEDLGPVRYVMLESIWEYEREKLQQSGEEEVLASRHLDYFLRQAEAAEPRLWGPEQAATLEELAAERGNLRVALIWAAESGAGTVRGLRLAAAVSRYWEIRSLLREGRELLSNLLARPEAQSGDLAQAKALLALGRLAWCQDDDAEARARLQEARALFQSIGHPLEAMLAQAMLGFVEWSDGHSDLSARYFAEAEAWARAESQELILAMSLSGQGTLAASIGDFETARRNKEEGLAIYRKLQDQWVVGLISWSLARVLLAQEDIAAAKVRLAEAVGIAQQLGNLWLMPDLLEAHAAILQREGAADSSARSLGTAAVLRERLGLRLGDREAPADASLRESLHTALGGEGFTQAVAAGRRLSPEEALRPAGN